MAVKALFGLAIASVRGEGWVFDLEHDEHSENVTCPVCHSRVIGRLGNSQYYCWDCCVQFSRTDRGVQTFRIDEDGSLVADSGAGEGLQHQVTPEGPSAVHQTTDQGGRWR